MSGISTLQAGQSDLELSSADAAVLLAPYVGTTPLLNLATVAGLLDVAKINAASVYQSVGNWTKDEGVSLTNKPTVNDIKSHGKGSPTRKIFSEAAKGITYTPQETKLINLQNAWGFPISAVTVHTAGDVLIDIPELPTNLLWRAVLLAWDSYNGLDLIRYWIANRVTVGERQDQQMKDSNTDNLGVSLSFESDPAVPGVPIKFGICGPGWLQLKADRNTGFASGAALTGIDATPATTSLDLSDGQSQQISVVDSNSVVRTAQASYGTSDETKALVSSTGLITPVAVGTASVTATYGGHTDTIAVTVVA